MLALARLKSARKPLVFGWKKQDHDNLSPGERAALHRLAQGEADEEELARRAELPIAGGHNLLVALAQVGLVQQVKGSYRPPLSRSSWQSHPNLL
jgi:predicted Rossmann fold nucleotide-binding protein DprA/Smf involved in DNA uptake